MAFVLDMASGKEYPGEKLDCPRQGSMKALLPDTSTANEPPALQLATVATQAPTTLRFLLSIHCLSPSKLVE